MKLTAEQLQDLGYYAARRGDLVHFVLPSEEAEFIKQQQPYVLRGKIPNADQLEQINTKLDKLFELLGLKQ